MLSDIPELLKRLLAARGIGEESIEAFLAPDRRDLLPPEALPGIREAAERILVARHDGVHVVVFGDYDCDGVSATAIVVKALRAIGVRVDPFIPRRLTEGYGMSDASVARMLSDYPDVGLVVTVDNGVNAVEQVSALKARGIPVVVTDHHLPGPELPEAEVMVDPKVAAPEALQILCGAGVAFFLARQLYAKVFPDGKGSPGVSSLLVLAGLATVTDIMSLTGQNRILVAEALKRFRMHAPLGLKELYERAARRGATEINSRDFGFLLGPRINAAGRMSTGMDALELILEEDREIAREFARIVDLQNTERKTVEQQMTQEAMKRVVPDAPAQVIDLSDGHSGVAGIVAARILEQLGGLTPVCVYSAGHGSARAPDGLNLHAAFSACSDCLSNWGGHAAAGGFSIKEGRVDEFRSRLCDYFREPVAKLKAAAKTEGERPQAELWIEPKDVTVELAEAIQLLEPFGEDNPEPVLGVKGMRLVEVRPLGQDGRHLTLSFGSAFPRGVWWAAGSRLEELRTQSSAPFDVTFRMILSEYQGRHVEVSVVAMAPSDPA